MKSNGASRGIKFITTGIVALLGSGAGCIGTGTIASAQGNSEMGLIGVYFFSATAFLGVLFMIFGAFKTIFAGAKAIDRANSDR